MNEALCKSYFIVVKDLPLEIYFGICVISLVTIFLNSTLMLNGSTMNGNVPVNMANVFTPLKRKKEKKRYPNYPMYRTQTQVEAVVGAGPGDVSII